MTTLSHGARHRSAVHGDDVLADAKTPALSRPKTSSRARSFALIRNVSIKPSFRRVDGNTSFHTARGHFYSRMTHGCGVYIDKSAVPPYDDRFVLIPKCHSELDFGKVRYPCGGRLDLSTVRGASQFPAQTPLGRWSVSRQYAERFGRATRSYNAKN